MKRSSIFQDPKGRESLALLLDYDFENPPIIQEQAQRRKPSFAPTRLKSAHSTFDLKGSQSIARDSKSFAPSKSTSMSHLSMSSIPMTTPVARPSSVHPKNVLETPKIPTSGVEPRIFREKDFIHTSAKLVHSFLTEKGYPKPIALKSLLNPESYEVLNIFSYLLSFLDSQLASEIRVKEDIPNVLAFIGYPYTIKKSTISALNTPHNWPSILASIRFIVERLEEVLPHDLGIDILFPPASFSEDAGSNEQFKENVIRNSQMYLHRDDPEMLESFRKETDEHYRVTLSELRSEKENLIEKRDEFAALNQEMDNSTLAVCQNLYQEKIDQLFMKQQELTSIQEHTGSNLEEKKRLDQELFNIQRQITEEDHKLETLSKQIQCQEINIDTAIELKDDTTSIRLEIDRQRTLISNYNDKIIGLRMQHSKRMSKVRAGMSQTNIALKQITLWYQGCYDGIADQLGIQYENANYEFMKSPEQLSNEIQRNMDILQQVRFLANSTKAKLLQTEIEANSKMESLRNSIVEAGLEIKEYENEMQLLQEANESLQKKKTNLQKEQSDKKIQLNQEVYQLRRDCEESARLVAQLETEREQVISSGQEENKRMHLDIHSLCAKIENMMDQIVKVSDEETAILSILEQMHGAYAAMFSKE
ncbi:Kinetochore protein NDC80-like [Oopsacas minuta]|uniref:Kinetochore protein NDC80 n=1 Tax=Oopsacas minuta TaxID=111878 RepID=A0AAV7KIP4_9METZ|nr:Kinetochore protein NDC80-like [Oopsacas minuta]